MRSSLVYTDILLTEKKSKILSAPPGSSDSGFRAHKSSDRLNSKTLDPGSESYREDDKRLGSLVLTSARRLLAGRTQSPPAFTDRLPGGCSLRLPHFSFGKREL